ncbi:MAG: hypothetical protein RJB01_173, partial [Actinomycetota bacterium]
RFSPAQLFPGLGWMRTYSRSFWSGDLIAALTVTAYLITQVMAYSSLAGLPSQAGLAVIVVAMLAYALLGTSRLLSVGPESSTALMTAAVLAPMAAASTARYIGLAASLALIVGALALVAWILKLGVISDLLSRPVLVGYMAGLGIIMILSQLGSATGLDLAGDTMLGQLTSLMSLDSLGNINWVSVGVALSIACILFAFDARWPRIPFALVLVLLATTATAAVPALRDQLEVVGTIPDGQWAWGLALPSIADFQLLLLPAVGVLVVGFADNTLTARMLATGTRERIRPNQEFLALGAANVAGSAVSGFPVSSSASRAVLARASGAKTQMYSVISALLVLVVVLVFDSLLALVPRAALAGIVIYAALRLIDITAFRHLRTFSSGAMWLAVTATLGVLLFDVLYGVLAAVGLSLIQLLYRVARPHYAVLGKSEEIHGWHDLDDLHEPKQVPGLVMFRYDSPLFFANAEDFCVQAERAVDSAQPQAQWLVINMEANTGVDVDACEALERLRQHCDRSGVQLVLARVKQEVKDLLDRNGFSQRLGSENFYPTLSRVTEAYAQRSVD